MRLVFQVFILGVLHWVEPRTHSCHKVHANVGNTTNYGRLSKLLSQSIDYATDPCVDFYHFACRKRNENIDLVEENHRKNYRSKMYEAIKAGILTDEGAINSKAVTAAQRFYKRCLERNSEWQFTGGSIQYVLKKIRSFGSFPLLRDERMHYNRSGLTSLFIYFSDNRVPMDVIVPHIGLHINTTEAYLRFSHTNMLEFVTSFKDEFHKMLFKLAVQLCLDSNSVCYTQKLIKDIGEVEDFFQKIVGLYYDRLQAPDLQKLKDVMKDMPSIDWLTYLREVAPPNVHSVFNENLPVVVKLSWGSLLLKKVEERLQATSGDVITNFVMLQYILSWLELLDPRYRSLLKNLSKGPDSEEDICFLLTKKRFPHALLAGYAKLTEGQKTKQFAEKIFEELREAFTNLVDENEIWSFEAKQALISKMNSMQPYVVFDDLHLGDFQSLDSFYREEIGAESRNMDFFVLENFLGQISSAAKYRLLNNNGLDNSKKVHRTLFNFFDFTTASHFRYMSKIICGPGFLQFPTFEQGLPRSYIYGSVGTIFGHEIMHGFDSYGIIKNEKGNLSWLSEEFTNEYNKRESCLKRKYSNSEVPGTYSKPHGGLTVEEDFADSEGLKLAFRAYKNAQKHFISEPRLSDVSDLNSDQLFFLGWASYFCENYGEDNRELVKALETDSYSIPMLRVNNPFSNMPEFGEAFHCSPRSRMNAADRRCRLLF